MRQDAKTLRAECARLARDAPREFAGLRNVFERMAPLLESDDRLMHSRGAIIMLAKEAEGELKAERTSSLENPLSRNTGFARGLAFFGGAAAVVWGFCFAELGPLWGAALKAGGGISILGSAGMKMAEMMDVGRRMMFSVDASVFVESVSREVSARIKTL